MRLSDAGLRIRETKTLINILDLLVPSPKLPAARSLQPLVRRRMRVSITIKKSPDHPLILRAMEARLSFEEIDASFRKRNCDLLHILTKY
jgi:hypothetical protein